MKLKVHGSSSTVDLADTAFAVAFNEPLVHQIVTAYAAGARAGSKAQKTRAEVRGGGAKPWNQKGSGRARAGTSRGPIWVGGGRTFAAKPRSYEQKVNRKMYRGALRSMLSELLRQERLLVTEELAVSAPKTKELKTKLAALNFVTGLVVVDKFDPNLWLSARNLPQVEVAEARVVDPLSLISADHVVVTTAALKIIEERLK
jgi:large subunit ribosomal protein L4